MSDLIKCASVSLQLDLEMANSHDIEKKKVHHLCSAFPFWYKTSYHDEYTLFVTIYFPTRNLVFHSDYNAVVKTFALLHGYYILGSELIDIPYSDSICLDV